MQTFGLFSCIVIGKQNQLDCLSNNNTVEQTKSPHPHRKAIYYAQELSSG